MQEIAVRVRTEAPDRHEPMKRLGADIHRCPHCKKQYVGTDIRHSVVVDWEDVSKQVGGGGGLVASLCSNQCAWWFSQHYRSMMAAAVTWKTQNALNPSKHMTWKVKEVHLQCLRIEGGRFYDVFPPPG